MTPHALPRIIERVQSLYRWDTPERKLVDLNEIIRQMVVLLQDTAHRHSISIRTELDPGLPRITADRVQLQQVLVNFMLNGIEAMKETSGELTVTSRTEDGHLLVSVSDAGIGLPVEDTERIFEAFFTTKRRAPGYGCLSVGGLSSRMAVVCGRVPIHHGARPSISH